MPMFLNVPLPGPFTYSTRLSGKRGGGGGVGCLGLFVVFAVVTYAFAYWQVTLVILGVAAVLGVLMLIGYREQRKQAALAAGQQAAAERHRRLDHLMSTVTTMPLPVQRPRR